MVSSPRPVDVVLVPPWTWSLIPRLVHHPRSSVFSLEPLAEIVDRALDLNKKWVLCRDSLLSAWQAARTLLEFLVVLSPLHQALLRQLLEPHRTDVGNDLYLAGLTVNGEGLHFGERYQRFRAMREDLSHHRYTSIDENIPPRTSCQCTNRTAPTTTSTSPDNPT